MIPVLVEGDTDVPVIRKLFDMLGLEIGTVYGLRGKYWLDQRLQAYNQAARHRQWFALRDLNGDADCAPSLLAELIPMRSQGMCFRVAVRAIESWLLADRQRIAQFLRVPAARVPGEPDAIANPKLEVVNLARRSRKRDIRIDMVPRPGMSARVGPGYSARIIEFAAGSWRPDVAKESSPSLARCIAALERLRL